MQSIEHIYINGQFVTPHGHEWFDLQSGFQCEPRVLFHKQYYRSFC